MWALVPLLVLAAFFVIFMVLPQRRQMQAVAAMQSRLTVGDDVITTSGIYGRIVALDDEVAEIEIAPGTRIKLARRAVGRRLAELSPSSTSSVPPPPGAAEPEPEA